MQPRRPRRKGEPTGTRSGRRRILGPPLSLRIDADVPLAPLTTLELGGPCRYFAEVSSAEELAEALDWARRQGVPAFVLGGGSNLVASDAGFPGLVIRMAARGLDLRPAGEHVHLEAAAGEPWDAVVTLEKK